MKEKEKAFSEHTQEAFFAHHNASAPSRASVVASFASVSSGDERSSPSRAVREADERSRLFMTRRLVSFVTLNHNFRDKGLGLHL